MSEQTNVAAVTAADIMRPPLTTVNQNDHVAAAAYLMKHAGTTALMVLDTQAKLTFPRYPPTWPSRSSPRDTFTRPLCRLGRTGHREGRS